MTKGLHKIWELNENLIERIWELNEKPNSFQHRENRFLSLHSLLRFDKCSWEDVKVRGDDVFCFSCWPQLGSIYVPELLVC